jgi:L-lactate dehydrogenase complex protein LldE
MPRRPQRTALFVTCLVDQIMPEVGVATVRLLRRANITVDFPEAQTCCGQPFFNSGFVEETRKLARKTIAALEPADAVVLPSGSCTTMIRVEYEHLLGDDPIWGPKATALAAKTYELGEYLVKKTDWRPTRRSEAPAVTYHDSCHMCRQLGLGAESRALLHDAGCEVHEMAEPDRCCGFGGLFSVRMPEVSNAMSSAKLRQAEATGAGMLVSADPGCLMQLRGLKHDGLELVHLASLLDRLEGA